MIAYQREIMSRFMPEGALKNFEQEYKDNLKVPNRAKVVTDKDLLILMDYKKSGLTLGELSRKYNVTRSQVDTSLRIAALSKL